MRLSDLKDQGWNISLTRSCSACQGRGSVSRVSYAGASLTQGYYGSSAAAEVACPQCFNGYVFAPLTPGDAMALAIEGFIDFLEKPENSALRKRYLDLYITDTELRLLGKAP